MGSGFKPLPVISLPTFPHPITALSFDPVSDTLWAGSSTGQVTALHGSQGMRGVSFPVGGDLGVSKISAGDNYVRACGFASNGIGSWAKGGMNKWFYRSSVNINTFTDTTGASHQIAVSDVSSQLLFLNSMTGNVVREVVTPSLVTHLQFSRTALVSGSSDGYLRVHDPRTGMVRPNAEGSVMVHRCGIQGIQATGNLIFTIGLGERQSRPFPDPLVKVYDMRTMRPLQPVPFSSGPAFIQLLPKRASSIIVTSNQGLINMVDVSNPSSSSEFYQLDLASYITSAAVSPTGAYMAFGDADGAIHILSQAEESSELPLNGFDGQPIELANTAAPAPMIEWDSDTPLNSVGLSFYDTELLSAWTPHFIPGVTEFPPPQKIPLQIQGTIKFNEGVAYAALPKELRGRRNVVSSSRRKINGRFRSGKSQQDEHEPETPVYDDAIHVIPRHYRRVEIEYSKFGVEDFDFAFYNKTEYSGLETHILNSYTNAMLQVMHYSLPIRQVAKSHITTSCPREHCLLCELGFVIRMLEDANGINCQSSNFCKTVGVLAQAQNAIELIEYVREPTDVNYSQKIQTFHRFLIEHLSQEWNASPHNPIIYRSDDDSGPRAAPITQLLGIGGKNVVTCLECTATREKETMTHVLDLAYPRKPSGSESRPSIDFPTMLGDSLLRDMTHKATCQACKQFATFTSHRSISSTELPPILALNACVFSEDTHSYWLDNKQQTFLSPTVQLQGQEEGTGVSITVTYEIRALIVGIATRTRPSHLVAIVKVPDAEERVDVASSWFAFNDFAVKNISEAEALSFPGRWKVPAIVYLERVDTRQTLDFTELPVTIDPSILSQDTSISLNRDDKLIKHEPLSTDELPRPGTLVAIDAEFVSMQQEETEIRSDGTTKVLRPPRLSLARVSVLRGSGTQQGIPFIDDHIHTSELIVDYLTEYSGIKFGDLDPRLSRYTLTPLKVVYKKLRLLVDLGCIFVGHGLSKDFRIINIFVPPEQVIDTVDLYFLKSRQRRLSLRFLSWFVLGKYIQTDTHDSIEDARSALNLYKAYTTFEEQGVFDQKLDEIYKEGKQYQFKPPPSGLPGSTSSVSLERAASPTPFAIQDNALINALYPISPPGTPSIFNPSGAYGAKWRTQ
ncbi:hypothetical protein M378DRAFT_184057 [Amanita muscaria Koide BX008]|uniref:PAN2-PAN3 deadenylation complex catalytic subunit PAN2 n=1 Tax=Amanita muscaria (strain Koide BX008) TaxID=946122 RepID=A0A0C2XKP2_AMAMK|nr:hypothetical protein M378DRAFT_184057 [Amanita muscaria Koide BX008]